MLQKNKNLDETILNVVGPTHGLPALRNLSASRRGTVLPILTAIALQLSSFTVVPLAGLSILGLMHSRTAFAAPSPYCDYTDEPDGDGDECPTPNVDPFINNGKPSSPCGAAGDPVNVGTGALFESQTDFVGSGPDRLIFKRYYNSGLLTGSIGMGVGWTFTYGAQIQILSSTQVRAVRSDGKGYTYNLAQGVWTTDPDVNDTLTEQTNAAGSPTGWTLKTSGDATETYNAAGQLLSIADRSGLTQILAYSTASTPSSVAPKAGLLLSVTNADGQQLQFTYDALGQLVGMITPEGAFQYAYDANNNLVTVGYPDGTTRKYQYGGGGAPNALAAIVDQDGQLYTSFSYDGYGNVSQSGHPGGVGQTNLSYGYASTTATGSLGAQRTYTFQDVLNVLKTTQLQTPCIGCSNPSNNLAIAYNANGYVSGYTDTPGDSSPAENTAFTWDTSRNLMLSRTAAAGSSVAQTTSLTWAPNFRLPATITKGSLTTAYTYDSHGNVTQEVQTDTANNLTRTTTVAYTYSSTVPGAVLQMVVTGPRTDLTQTTTTHFYAPDATCPGSAPLGCRGQIQSVTNALGQTTTVDAYNAAGKPLHITDPNGLVIQLSYDTLNRLTAAQVGAETTQYQYDPVGDLTQVTRPDGSTVAYRYDAAHRLIGIALADGSHVAYTLDAAGDITQEQILDGSGHVTYTHSRVYDALGRLSQDVGAYNQTVADTRDAHNNLTSQNGPRTDISDVTSYQYDPLNRLIQVTQANGGVDKMAYDGLNHLTQVTDPDNQVTQYTPDAWGDALKTVSADTGTTVRTFDAAGNVLTATDAMGQVTTYTYDALNRVITKSSSVSGTPAYTFVYDTCAHGIGHLCTVEDNGAPTIAFTYDSQERLASRTDTIQGTSVTTAYTYHPGGQIASLTYPSGQTVLYAYDTLGRINQVSVQPPGGGAPIVLASNFTYNPFAGPASYTFGNGASYVQTLNLDGLPTVEQSGPWVKSASYDQANDLSVLLDANNTKQTYSYDAMGHLTAAQDTSSGGFGSRAYSDDPNGNRTSVTRNSATQTYTYSPPNWLAQDGANNQLRNADGNLAFISTPTLQGTLVYDGYARPVGLQNPPGVAYGYNAFNERTYKDIQGQVTGFVYGQSQELLGEQTAGGPEQDYVYLYGKLLARLDTASAGAAPTVYYVHTDALGTPQAMTNANQQIVWQASYTPFGTATITQQSIVNNLRFPGQYFDQETGANYNLNRFYDPNTGRYISADPTGLAAGTNLYAYVGGNPLNYIDPWGENRNAPPNASDPNGPKAPGLPGPENGYFPPKGGPQWVPNPNPGKGGSSHGWKDKKGNVWCPSGQGGRAHGGPHWDVQTPGGGHENVFPLLITPGTPLTVPEAPLSPEFVPEFVF